MWKFIKGTLRVLAPILVVFAIIIGVLKLFFVDVAVMNHNGMAPNIEAGDQFLIWRDAEPTRGEIAVCTHPRRPGEIVIGRVIGEAGHTLDSVRGQLKANNQTIPINWSGDEQFTDTVGGTRFTVQRGSEQYQGHSYDIFLRQRSEFEIRATTVPAGKIYLLSDNRTFAARDSRSFGAVLVSECRGTAFMVFKPSPDSPNALNSWLEIL